MLVEKLMQTTQLANQLHGRRTYMVRLAAWHTERIIEREREREGGWQIDAKS